MKSRSILRQASISSFRLAGPARPYPGMLNRDISAIFDSEFPRSDTQRVACSGVVAFLMRSSPKERRRFQWIMTVVHTIFCAFFPWMAFTLVGNVFEI